MKRLKQEAQQMPSSPLSGWPCPGLTGLHSLAIFEERHHSILRDMEHTRDAKEHARGDELKSLKDLRLHLRASGSTASTAVTRSR